MKAYGTFTKIGDYIYRTDTYLQFGDSEELLGACVLCNPGSAKAHDDSIENKILSFNGPGNLELKDVKLKEDATMRQLNDILVGIHKEKLEGRFKIFNLFTLKEPKMKIAINLIKNKKLEEEEMLYKDFKDFQKLQLDHNKIILSAWGVDDSMILRDLKCNWNNLINNIQAKKLGKFKEKSHYYHPLPQLQDDKIAYVNYIIDQYFNL